MPTPPFDELAAHRWFAVEYNNRSWDLVEAPQRSPAEADQMIHFAHAACIHWLAVGTVVNQVRGQCLLATAYAAARIPDAATRHAAACLTLCEQSHSQITAFDLASAYGSAANAYACAGDMVRAGEYYQTALLALGECTDPEDRPVFERLYPAPSLGG